MSTMANNISLGKLILDRLESIDSNVERMESRVERVDQRVEKVEDKVDSVNEALGGDDGIRERLTALEVKVDSVSDNTPRSISMVPAKKTAKEQVTQHAGTAGIVTAVLAIVELAKSYLSTK